MSRQRDVWKVRGTSSKRRGFRSSPTQLLRPLRRLNIVHRQTPFNRTSNSTSPLRTFPLGRSRNIERDGDEKSRHLKKPKWPQRARERPPPCWCVQTTRTSKSQRGSLCFQYTEKKKKTKDWRRSLGFTAVKKNKENKNKIKQNKHASGGSRVGKWLNWMLRTDRQNWQLSRFKANVSNKESKE